MRATGLFFVLALSVCPTVVWAQSESVLKQAFEGRTMVLRVDMPATQLGVDVYPERPQPVDFGGVARRLKEYGTAIHQGEAKTITLIRVKSDHVEVHLAGGGYGTFTDLLAQPQKTAAPSPFIKTSRERDLEDRIKHAYNDAERRRLQRELDDVRRDKREDATDAAVTNRLADQEIRDRRLGAGSRFNVRFQGNSVPAQYLTPDGLASALSRLGALDGTDVTSFAPSAQTVAPIAPLGGITSIKKGMSLADVEKALGPADEVTKHDAGGLEITERVYLVGERRVLTRFASGVLIEYSIQSR